MAASPTILLRGANCNDDYLSIFLKQVSYTSGLMGRRSYFDVLTEGKPRRSSRKCIMVSAADIKAEPRCIIAYV
jgi:hypothetical protein